MYQFILVSTYMYSDNLFRGQKKFAFTVRYQYFLKFISTTQRNDWVKSNTINIASTNFSFQVQSSCLFNLLLSLETPSPDPLHIAELIKEDKPLKPIDFCYRDEDEMVNVLDCISLCVMVVSYSAESIRGYQMLVSISLRIYVNPQVTSDKTVFELAFYGLAPIQHRTQLLIITTLLPIIMHRRQVDIGIYLVLP